LVLYSCFNFVSQQQQQQGKKTLISDPVSSFHSRFFSSPHPYSGLCSVFRSRAGEPTRLDEILKQPTDAGGDDDDDPVLEPEIRVKVSRREEDHRNNAHLVDDNDDGGGGSGPSRYVAYCDAASLYPSSGE